MTAASLEQNMTAARHEHLVPGRELHMQDMRGYRFCEVGPCSTPPTVRCSSCSHSLSTGTRA